MRRLFGNWKGKQEPNLVEAGAEVLEVHLDGFRYVVRLDSGEEKVAFKAKRLGKRVFSVGDHVKVKMMAYDSSRVKIIA